MGTIKKNKKEKENYHIPTNPNASNGGRKWNDVRKCLIKYLGEDFEKSAQYDHRH